MPSPGDAIGRTVPNPGRLTGDRLAQAVDELAARDPDLAGIVARHGPPPLVGPGARLSDAGPHHPRAAGLARLGAGRVRPTASRRRPVDADAGFLELTDAELLAIGFSRQKARYGRALAEAIESGELDLESLDSLDDDAVHRALQAVPGIGPWTSTVYLLMVLLRPDLWPVGDIALAASVGEVKGLGRRPDPAEMADLGRGLATVAIGRGAALLARLPGAPGPGRVAPASTRRETARPAER